MPHDADAPIFLGGFLEQKTPKQGFFWFRWVHRRLQHQPELEGAVQPVCGGGVVGEFFFLGWAGYVGGKVWRNFLKAWKGLVREKKHQFLVRV